MKQNNRHLTLLRAAFDMLRKCQESHFVISPMETSVFYDEADCDGTCLLEDIATYLGIDETSKPLEKL